METTNSKIICHALVGYMFRELFLKTLYIAFSLNVGNDY